jgi:hypothetical protein
LDQTTQEGEMTTHDKIVSALTQWDIKQSKRDKHHNPYFIGIALNNLRDFELEQPGATAEEIVRECFNGRLADFILKFIAK